MARAGRRVPTPLERLHRPDGAIRGRRDHVLRLHQGHPVHARLPCSRRSSSRPTRSGPTRPCGSRASRSARSSRSSRVEGSNAALLVMELNDSALPLHEDATAKIRPRIFLEGNFFVDLKPGTPGSPQLDSGDTITITQTATPVQLDEVLTSLQSDSREDLQGAADRPQHGVELQADGRREDADADRWRAARRAAESFNDALDDIPAAEKSTARCFEALLGTEPDRDVARLIRGTANTADELDRYEGEAQGPDHEPQHDDGDVRERVGEPARDDPRAAGPTLATANAAFTSLNAAFPPTRAFASEILPGRRGDAGDDRRRVPVDRADAQARRPGRARRPRRGALAGHAPTWRKLIDRADRAAAADRPRRPSACATSSCPPAISSIQDEFTTGVGELQGVLLRAGRARRRGPEHRRQRHVRALPDRRRLADGLAGQREHEHRRAVRQQHRGAARQPAGLPGQAPALQARRALLQAEDPGRQRSRRGEVAPTGAATAATRSQSAATSSAAGRPGRPSARS